jgi:hypothetical protein
MVMSALPVAENCSPLTSKQQHAAELCAADEKTDEAIAALVGVAPRTLWYWKRQPAFDAEVRRLRDLFRQQAMDRATFADKRARVVALNGVAADLLAQLARAEYQVVLRTTDDGEAVLGFDAARVRELRGCLADLAAEVGDRQNKGASATAAVVVKFYGDPRMDNPLEANWDDAPPPRSSADA